jgi:hypothetical protein
VIVEASAEPEKPIALAAELTVETPELEFGPPDTSGDIFDNIARHDERLAEAAKNGWEALRQAWRETPFACQSSLKAALDRRHKPAALLVDAEKAKQNA